MAFGTSSVSKGQRSRDRSGCRALLELERWPLAVLPLAAAYIFPMSQTTHPSQLVGTWECVESYRKSGELMPQPEGVPRVTYALAADGSGTVMPGTIAAWPMRWSVADGRLRLGT